MSVSNTMLYYAGAVAVLRGASLLMLPVVTAFVDIDEYGKLNILSSFTGIIGLILSFGLGETIFRFAANAESERRTRIYSWSFSISVVGATIFSGIGWLGADYLSPLFPLAVYPEQLRYVFITLGCTAVTTVPYAIWRLAEDARSFFIFALVHVTLQNTTTLMLLHLGLGINAPLISGAFATVITSGWLLWHFRDLLSAKLFASKPVSIAYAINIMLSSTVMFFIQGIEQWIIAAYLGAAAVASYFIAAQLGLAVSLAIEPFKMWWFARRYRSIEDTSINNALYAVLGTELAAFAALVIINTVPVVMSFVLGEAYLGALYWLPWVCVIAVAKLQSDFLNLGCYATGKGQIPFFINLAAGAISIVCAVFMVELWGLAGVMTALFIANTTRMALFYVISQSLLYQCYNTHRLIIMWVWLSVAFIANILDTPSISLLALCIYGVSLISAYRNLITPVWQRLRAALARRVKSSEYYG